MRPATVFAMVFVVVLPLAAGGQAKKEPQARIRSGELLERFDKNAVELEESLGGKFIELAGTVGKVSRVNTDTRVVEMAGYTSMGFLIRQRIYCYFGNDDKLGDLQADKAARFRGTLKIGRKGPELHGCERAP